MLDYEPKYLVMVAAGANNNKMYRMIPNGDYWTAEYGRIGAGTQSRTYHKSQWESKYREKINKGYVDQTELVQDLIAEKKPAQSEYKAIENQVISEIVERLQHMAREAIKANYTVSSNKVTQAMIDEAQNILTSLINVDSVDQFNDILVKLFTVIPRKMESVRNYLARSASQFGEIITREQDLLDVMKGQVIQKVAEDEVIEQKHLNEKTVLEQFGLEFEECTADDIASIKVALGSCADKFRNAWKVKNLRTQKRFDNFVAQNNITDVRLLFHGSRNENWWSIINNGLVLRPTNAVITGKMFGYGIYYAPKAKKSLGYTSLSGSYWAKGNSQSGFMALMNVAYGKPYDVYSFENRYSSLNYEALQKACPGANCVHAHEGAMLCNDEIIIYKEEQCTIKYLVELRN